MKEKSVYTFEDGEIEVSIDEKIREKLEKEGVDVDSEIRKGIRKGLEGFEDRLNLDENQDTREFLQEEKNNS